MDNKIKHLQASSIEGISKVLGDTKSGLSGSVISQYLTEMGIEDVDSANTKWKKLYHALINNQNKVQCSNEILNFVKHVSILITIIAYILLQQEYYSANSSITQNSITRHCFI